MAFGHRVGGMVPQPMGVGCIAIVARIKCRNVVPSPKLENSVSTIIFRSIFQRLIT